jgi:hypothetical protein
MKTGNTCFSLDLCDKLLLISCLLLSIFLRGMVIRGTVGSIYRIWRRRLWILLKIAHFPTGMLSLLPPPHGR